MKKIHLVALALAGGMLAAAGCDDLDAADPNLPKASTSGDVGTPAKKQQARDDGLLNVTYKITGKASRGMLTYSTPSGQEQTTRNLPWKKTFKVKEGTGEFLSISVQNEGSSGDVVCEISVDGKRVKRARSTGAYAIASCDHMLGF